MLCTCGLMLHTCHLLFNILYNPYILQKKLENKKIKMTKGSNSGINKRIYLFTNKHNKITKLIQECYRANILD